MAHYYNPSDATPRHFVPMSTKGGVRPTRVTDAKKHGWYPSVNEVLGIIYDPGLEHWKQTGLVEHTMECMVKGINIKRVVGEYQSKVSASADLGTSVHDAIEKYLGQGKEPDPIADFPIVDVVNSADEIIDDLSPSNLELEKTVVNNVYGFGGTVDAFGVDKHGNNFVLDWKTTSDINRRLDKHWQQLSAYGHTVFGPEPFDIYNVFIGTKGEDKGAMLTVQYEQERIDRGWRMFLNAFSLWQEQKQYYPTGVLKSRCQPPTIAESATGSSLQSNVLTFNQ